MATARGIASNTFRSLKTRNYRLFFIGQGISLCGTWMQTIALGWLVLHLSHNSGLAIGAAIAPAPASDDKSAMLTRARIASARPKREGRTTS